MAGFGCERQQEMDFFHWQKRYRSRSRLIFWPEVMVWSLNTLMMDLFQLLSSQDVNWWTGVVWITCGLLMFLSAVWTLILTAPIHCRASIGEQVMQCYISPNLCPVSGVCTQICPVALPAWLMSNADDFSIRYLCGLSVYQSFMIRCFSSSFLCRFSMS